MALFLVLHLGYNFRVLRSSDIESKPRRPCTYNYRNKGRLGICRIRQLHAPFRRSPECHSVHRNQQARKYSPRTKSLWCDHFLILCRSLTLYLSLLCFVAAEASFSVLNFLAKNLFCSGFIGSFLCTVRLLTHE